MNLRNKNRLYIIYNFFRITLIKLFHSKQFKGCNIQKISPATKFNLMDKNSEINLGKRLHMLDGTLINADGGKISIGDYTFINRNCNIVSKKRIEIGRETSIGPGVQIYDHDHALGDRRGNFECDEIKIGNGCWIGANAVILRGTIIGDNSVVGAGTVVKGEVGENKIIYSVISIL